MHRRKCIGSDRIADDPDRGVMARVGSCGSESVMGCGEKLISSVETIVAYGSGGLEREKEKPKVLGEMDW